MSSAPDHVHVDTADRVCTIGFARPDKKNALTRAMYVRVAEALDAAAADESVRAVLVRGTDDCFTAGNDLHDFLHAPPSGPESPVFQLLLRLCRFEKPLLAAVEGPAVGLGTTLLLHCDLVVAGDGARLSLPFVALGLCPEAAATFLLPRMLGHARAAELLLLGEPIDAARACALGLVNRVCPAGSAGREATALARALAEKPPAAVRVTKRLLRADVAARVEEALHREGAEFVARLSSPEAREAMSAFLGRRKPDFSRFS
jgi:enoyl-CoA hydratase/carnithine racemase